jgi:hypothetical protein
MDERAWRKRQGNRRWRPSEERRTKSEGSVNPHSNLTWCSHPSRIKAPFHRWLDHDFGTRNVLL